MKKLNIINITNCNNCAFSSELGDDLHCNYLDPYTVDILVRRKEICLKDKPSSLELAEWSGIDDYLSMDSIDVICGDGFIIPNDCPIKDKGKIILVIGPQCELTDEEIESC